MAGARPNFVKIAPIQRELAARGELFVTRLVHTGQHYDAGLSQVFFDQLEIGDHPAVKATFEGARAKLVASMNREERSESEESRSQNSIE